jgi:homoserine dehydrogenase
MAAIHIALLGFGTVGKGVYQTVQKHQKRLQTILGKEVKIVVILVKELEKHQWFGEDVIFTDKFDEIINIPKLDVVIDAICGIEPGFSYLQQAINRGCHVITANKEMFAHKGSGLLKQAKEKQVSLGFEATVAGGIPIIQTLKKLLNVNKVEKVEGIVNGTSNFILSKMREDDLSFEEALTLAQDYGYAEVNPANDIDGKDAFYKAAILSEVIFGKQPAWDQAYVEGIRRITLPQMKWFESWGLRFKHVISLQKLNDDIKCTVRPVLVTKSNPLYHVEYVHNAINIEADIVGNISLQGPGAGMFPTASAIIEDLIHLGDSHVSSCFEIEQSVNTESSKLNWVIQGKNIHLPKNMKVKEEIKSRVFLVEATDDNIRCLKKSPGICCFEVLGADTEETLFKRRFNRKEHIKVGFSKK